MPHEDEQLRELVEKHGETSWMTIARELPGRSCRQCRERWLNYLSPRVQNGPWSEAETTLLFEKVTEFGTSWKTIQRYFPGRTDINIRNHYRHLQREIPIKVEPGGEPMTENPPTTAPPRPPGDSALPVFDNLFHRLVREGQNGSSQDETNLFSFQMLF
jgi:hypothetical protein